MKLDRVYIEYNDGEDNSASFDKSSKQGGLGCVINNGDRRFSCTLDCKEETVIKSLTAKFSYEFTENDRLFLNGYQSWTDSREHSYKGRMRRLSTMARAMNGRFFFDRYGDYRFAYYGTQHGQMHGFSYAYVRRGEEYTLFCSVCEESGYTIIRFDATDNTVTLEKECADHHFEGEYKAFDLYVLTGTENEVFDEYFKLLGIAPCGKKRITGYTSWYNLYENISEESVMKDLRGFASSNQHPDVFQIDDGYESAVGDWLTVDENKFPNGMKQIAERIKACGMMPGIWLAPFSAELDSKIFREHKDWIIKDEKGEPVACGSNWSTFFGLDIYNPEVVKYLEKVFDTVINEWGYKLLKLDFLYSVSIIPRRDKTRAQVMYDGMRLLRRLCKDALILGCGVPLAPAFGLVDYCRIGCDVDLRWDGEEYMKLMHRERTSTKNCILNTVFRRQLDGRAFRCDPDVFLLRDDNIRLNDGQKKALATVNALLGGVLFTSDDVSAYPQRVKEFYDSLMKLNREDFISADLINRYAVIKYRKEGKEETISIPTFTTIG